MEGFLRRPIRIDIEALVPSWLGPYVEVAAGLSLKIVLIATTPKEILAFSFRI